jgi:hypothetical protein
MDVVGEDNINTRLIQHPFHGVAWQSTCTRSRACERSLPDHRKQTLYLKVEANTLFKRTQENWYYLALREKHNKRHT